MTARGWCYTYFPDVNEGNDQWIDYWKALESDDRTRWGIHQWEISPEGNKLHAQGAVWFHKPSRFTAVKKLLPTGAHIEAARSGAAKSRAYCSKEESRVPDGECVEWGDFPKQGRRTDLEDLAEAVLDGASNHMLAHSRGAQVIRYGRGIERLRQWGYKPPMDDPQEVIVLHGPAGSGKTRSIYACEEADEIYSVPLDETADRVWFDGYEGQKVILFDDFVPNSNGMLSAMLRWLDRYPVQLPFKGGFVWRRSTKIYITSNTDPKDWFPSAGADRRAAFWRRVSLVSEVGGNT